LFYKDFFRYPLPQKENDEYYRRHQSQWTRDKLRKALHDRPGECLNPQLNNAANEPDTILPNADANW